MARRNYLASYRPLIATGAGRVAWKKYGLLPFIDGSCRREPDFESDFPSISAICRKGKFAPKLFPGDRVIYITIRGVCPLDPTGWGLAAVLQVEKRFSSHDDAAKWYRAGGMPVPSNCLVEGNPPIELDRTHLNMPESSKKRFLAGDHVGALAGWNSYYRSVARRYPVFLTCKRLQWFPEEPRVITPDHMKLIFGKAPGTQNPRCLTEEEFCLLLSCAGINKEECL
ncbi:hypothetical protein [Sorangium cellulosum]|uniref:hypothetical protein n=1 Tax=Sorangium cellulosum TaxID=56 RepID=UPI00101286E0|nr:hypothetical protein [Sorangium cellulosum]